MLERQYQDRQTSNLTVEQKRNRPKLYACLRQTYLTVEI